MTYEDASSTLFGVGLGCALPGALYAFFAMPNGAATGVGMAAVACFMCWLGARLSGEAKEQAEQASRRSKQEDDRQRQKFAAVQHWKESLRALQVAYNTGNVDDDEYTEGLENLVNEAPVE